MPGRRQQLDAILGEQGCDRANNLLIWTTCEYELSADGTNGLCSLLFWRDLLRAFSSIGIQFFSIANSFTESADSGLGEFGC